MAEIRHLPAAAPRQPDPLGDLETGRYDRLAAAALADAGLAISR